MHHNFTAYLFIQTEVGTLSRAYLHQNIRCGNFIVDKINLPCNGAVIGILWVIRDIFVKNGDFLPKITANFNKSFTIC